MPRQLVIIGNSGAARECHWLATDMMQQQPDLRFKGFLAFEGHSGDLKDLVGYELGGDDEYRPGPDDVFAIGIGLPALRHKAYTKWKERGARFINLIHPTVTLHPATRMGEATIMTHGCYISCDVCLGNANYLNGSVALGHDTRVGDYNFFGPFSLTLSTVHIGNGNSLGARCVIMPQARMGNRNTIAPGAYVYKGCGDNRVMAGNPAYDVSGMSNE